LQSIQIAPTEINASMWYLTCKIDRRVLKYCLNSSFVKTNLCLQTVLLTNTRPVLSKGGPRDAAVHFDRYLILQRHRVVSLPQHVFLVGLCLQTAVNYLSKSGKC